MSGYPIVRFLNALAWEFFQNIWGVVFFVAAVWLWSRANRGKALVCIVAVGVASAGAIYLTEAIKSGHQETLLLLLANIVSMTLLPMLIVPYLSREARWSSRKTDVLVGLLAGAGLAIAQKLADPASPWIGVAVHAVALGAAAAMVLISVRGLKVKTLPAALGWAALIATAMTLIIGLIDYSYLLL